MDDRLLLDALRHEVHTMGPLRDLKDMVTRAEGIYGDRTAIVEKKRLTAKTFDVVSHTVNEFAEKRLALGTALVQRGFAGKHIAILGESSFNWILSFFSIVCGVGTAVPIDKELTDEEISRLLSKGDVSAVFCTKTYFDCARKHLQNDSRCELVVSMNRDVNEEKFVSVEDLITEGKELLKNGDRRYVDAEIDRESTCAIVFTSGTTGANKGVMLTHHNFAANVDNIIEIIPTEYSSFSLLPMNHVFELSCNIMTAFYMNAVIYVNDSLKNILANIQLFKPDAMNAVPLVLEGIYNGIWEAAKKKGKDKALRKLVDISNALRKKGIDLRPVLFATIRKNFGDKMPTLVCGGAPSRKDYVSGLGDFGFRVYNGYGLTESSPTVTLNMDASADPTSAGFAAPRSEFTIHEPDEDGIGEIWIRGENVFKAYYNDPEATAASFEDGWFKTGDYGRSTENGELFVVGRKKSLIILEDGKNVFPEDIEFEVMDNIGYIREACAFEATKEIHGVSRKIIAVGVYVEPADFDGLSEADIIQKVRDDILNNVNRRMPSYKKIQDVFVTFHEYEKTSTRKIIRQKVIDAYYAQ